MEGLYYQVDVVDDPACPERPPRETPGSARDAGTIMVSRLCERAKSLAPCPDIQGPSFLRDELVKFIESAKLGEEQEEEIQPSLDPYLSVVASNLPADLETIIVQRSVSDEKENCFESLTKHLGKFFSSLWTKSFY